MEIPLFDQVADLVRAMAPEELGEVGVRAHRRGLKVWFRTGQPGKEHYEAQILPRHYVDGKSGKALEIGFHSEHADVDTNSLVIETLMASEKKWRKALGPEAEVAPFFGADNWRRISEAWIEPNLDDPDLAFEIASRLIDYVTSLEPARP